MYCKENCMYYDCPDNEEPCSCCQRNAALKILTDNYELLEHDDDAEGGNND